MSNVVDKAWVIYIESKDKTFIQVTPVIYLSRPEPEFHEDVHEFSTVFDARKFINANVNTQFSPIRIVA